MKTPILHVLYTAIGRGHPYYLDGVVTALTADYAERPAVRITDVFSLSHGLALTGWRMVRGIYRRGGQRGIGQAVYRILRSDHRPFGYGIGAGLLAGGIRKYFTAHPGPTLVAHPLVVPMIKDLVPVYYQHGEVSAPVQAAVDGAHRIFVPTEACKTRFVEQGITPDNLVVTGLCIESPLEKSAQNNYDNRQFRIEQAAFLSGAFFSSGAEPAEHVQSICTGAQALLRAGHQPLVYCAAGGRLEAALSRIAEAFRIRPDQDGFSFEKTLHERKILVVIYSGREALDRLTSLLFRYFDFIVAPSHERTNWAIGLGVPMFILHPVIGPFSPLNRRIMLDQSVAVDLHEPEALGETVTAMRTDGRLAAMARKGWGKYEIHGFAAVADYLVHDIGHVS
ncbi:MAG: hypothetical protein JW763_04720 [candidate division Zixibacteria bacterium]|nr:hypothetical protein [candidate division Zixibacteria bacterium]